MLYFLVPLWREERIWFGRFLGKNILNNINSSYRIITVPHNKLTEDLSIYFYCWIIHTGSYCYCLYSLFHHLCSDGPVWGQTKCEIWIFWAEMRDQEKKKKHVMKTEEGGENVGLCQMTWFLWQGVVTTSIRSSVTFSQRTNFSIITLIFLLLLFPHSLPPLCHTT